MSYMRAHSTQLIRRMKSHKNSAVSLLLANRRQTAPSKDEKTTSDKQNYKRHSLIHLICAVVVCVFAKFKHKLDSKMYYINGATHLQASI